jgi:hypothetical protein
MAATSFSIVQLPVEHLLKVVDEDEFWIGFIMFVPLSNIMKETSFCISAPWPPPNSVRAGEIRTYFGGNSNWRGPVGCLLNCDGDPTAWPRITVEYHRCPTGSGVKLNLRRDSQCLDETIDKSFAADDAGKFHYASDDEQGLQG